MSAAVADRLRTTFRRQGLLAGLTIAITIAAWPVRLAPAQTGLDPSWAIALHVSIWDHLQYGVDFVMTYGPLGFLGYPRPVLGGTSTLAFAAYLTLELGLIATLLALARNALPLWAAAIVALVAGRLIVVLPFWESMQALVFIFAARAVLEPPTGRGWRVAVIAGVVSAVAVLGKLNVGVFVAAMAFVVVATTAISWRRSIGVFFGSAAIAFAGLWTATGQSLGNVLAYASSELEVISRYSQAMATDRDPALHWIYIGYGFVALGVLALAVAAWQRTANRRLLSGAGLAGLVALLLFAEWKTAFTRTYPSYAFSTLLIAAFAFAPRREQAQGERAQGERPSLTWLGVATAAAVALAAVTAMPPSTLIDVPSSARAFAVQAADAALPGRFERAAQQTRTSLLEALALPPDVSSALAGQTVHIEPWETSVAYAVEGVRWTPLPLFQAYIVWSSAMDERNAAVLQGPNAPTLILREALFHGRLPAYVARQLGRPLEAGERVAVAVDGRFRWFEEPATTLEILCRYRERISSVRWQVLDRTSGSCGPPEPLSVVTAPEGETVPVPVESRPGRFVIVRVRGLEPSLVTQARISLWKGPEWYVTAGSLRYRLVPGIATDGLLLAVPTEADGTGSFSFGPPIPTIAIQTGLGRGGDRTLTYEFFSVPLLPGGSTP